MTAIETVGLRKHFGDVVAVDGLDMTVERGEVFGFLGPNGAGKSTTINVLLGFLDPTDGHATVLGHDVETESQAVREGIGVLPENYSAYDRLTAREHVEYAAGLKGSDPDVESLLERVGLERDAWDRRAGDFSTGMEKRLALATALVGDPDLLILDEPSSGLDPEGMAEMRDIVRAEAEAGTTVFFSSHILSEVEAVCDRIGMLVEGDLAAIGTLEELRAGSDVRVPIALTVDAVPESIERDLAAVSGVRSVAVDGDQIEAEVEDASHKIDVIRAVDERATVEDVIAEAASLESMFHRFASGGRESEGGEAGADGTPASERASPTAEVSE